MRTVFRIMFLAIAVSVPATLGSAQPGAPRPVKEIFRDHDGNLISNNEFVDIRMANFHYPDATIVKTLEDGTVEFRLQKIPQEGMGAPAFSVKTVDGKTLNSSELKGKVVVIDFWYIGCPACLNIEPKLNAFKERFSGEKDVVFLAMTPDPAHAVKKYLSKQPFGFIHAVDAKTAMNAFVFSGFPKNIVIGRDGKIAYWRSTIHAWDKFESVVRGELAK
jgi:peroxiredoxin